MPAPFTSASNRNMFTKIIVIYTLFYVAMKIMAIFQGAWLWVNLTLCVPFVILAIWGGISIKRNATNWFYVIISILVVSTIRFYEANLMIWLHERFFS